MIVKAMKLGEITKGVEREEAQGGSPEALQGYYVREKRRDQQRRLRKGVKTKKGSVLAAK